VNNFWQKLKKPFLILAPMADVTDPAFRRIVAECGKPDVFFTEFVSADGLAHPAAREKLLRDLSYTEAERPIVAQLFSSKPENIKVAAKLCAELGFDGVDINMGCPDRSIEKQGAGASMIKNPEKAKAVIRAAKDGIKESGRSIPVSVKTRIGYSREEIDTWLPVLLSEDIAALTVHLRTRKEMSEVPAHWEYMQRIVDLRDKLCKTTLIVGNGDVRSVADGDEKARETGADGIMIGRAVFGNPWIFSSQTIKRKNKKTFADIYHFVLQKFGKKDRYWLRAKDNTDIKTKLETLVKHAALFEELLGDVKSFAVMKKHFKAYVNGFSGAKELRNKLMEAGNDAASVRSIISTFLAG
jgi:tRNA-dihydrouridine synthase